MEDLEIYLDAHGDDQMLETVQVTLSDGGKFCLLLSSHIA